MSSIQNVDTSRSASIFTLFSPQLLPATLMLGGGVALYAVESYITATIAPSIVRDIGGLELFSWMITLFVAAGVLGSITVATRPRGIGLRTVYIAAALIFGAGNLICAIAPAIQVVLAGRAVQGFGAGMLGALGYAFIRFVYPEPLWRKASTLYAAIWGVATVLGPTLGGLFSQGSAWREAFIILVPLAGLMALSARWLLPRVEDDRAQQKTPILQIALLLGAVLLVSLAGTIEHMSGKIILVAISMASVSAMLTIERKSANRLLPQGAVMLSKPICRLYLMIFTLMMVLTSDIYIPYFLQTLHGVAPLVSGYLVALVALGWTLAAFLSASFSGKQADVSIIVGCVLETAATASPDSFPGKGQSLQRPCSARPGCRRYVFDGLRRRSWLGASGDQGHRPCRQRGAGQGIGCHFDGSVAGRRLRLLPCRRHRQRGRSCRPRRHRRRYVGGHMALCIDGPARPRRLCDVVDPQTSFSMILPM